MSSLMFQSNVARNPMNNKWYKHNTFIVIQQALLMSLAQWLKTVIQALRTKFVSGIASKHCNQMDD
jgi:hypothetical protein